MSEPAGNAGARSHGGLQWVREWGPAQLRGARAASQQETFLSSPQRKACNSFTSFEFSVIMPQTTAMIQILDSFSGRSLETESLFPFIPLMLPSVSTSLALSSRTESASQGSPPFRGRLSVASPSFLKASHVLRDSDTCFDFPNCVKLCE